MHSLLKRAKETLLSQAILRPNEFTTGAFDYFDHEEATLSGIYGSHDTVLVLYQNRSSSICRKPLISETNVTHGQAPSAQVLSCQELKEFIKLAKRGEIDKGFKVQTNLFSMDEKKYDYIKRQDIAFQY